MRWVEHLHTTFVVERRARVLSSLIAPLVPVDASVLDVGSGDARIARRVSQMRPDLCFTCMDVLVRPATAFPVIPFDGERIPFLDGSFDCVLLVDVVHHAANPFALLREVARVAGGCIVIKDHVRQGLLAYSTLR